MSLHLIDNDGHLQSEKDIIEYVASTVPKTATSSRPSSKKSATGPVEQLREMGVNYHVVGVFGGQSSGKSTLLNHLFATDFQVLDDTVRRGQTTKGAFLSKANNTLEGFVDTKPDAVRAPLLIVDFEGTDGIERGDDQSFERQLSLFGLSLADTLIINMWSVDVGRFNAANLSLLRTIFEVNLQLFAHESYEKEEKPTLLIILRDFTDPDPAPSLTTVRKSFDMIWDNITRPAQFASAKIDALFNLKYYVMPHYRLQRKEFDASVVSLRHWFGDSQSKDYLFRHSAMFRGVPMETLPYYMSSCWETICSSKDLDIPTQREMLAEYRCKEVKAQELRNFLAFTRHYEDRIGRGELLLRLSEVMDEEMDTRLKEYTRQTKLYNPEVAQRFLQDLEQELVDATMKVVGRLSSVVAMEVLAGLDARLQGAVDDCIYSVLKGAQSLPFESSDSTSNRDGDVMGSLATADSRGMAIDHAARFHMNNEQCQHLVTKFWKTLRSDLNTLLNEMTVDPPPSHLFGRFTSLVAQDPTARGNVINTVTEALFKKVNSRVVAMSESTTETIHRGFEQCLSHSSDGTVKFFATTKGLQQAVPSAQQAGLVFMGCLLYFRLKLASANTDAEDGNGDSNASSAVPSSRSARRVVQNRKRVSVRQDAYERQFYLSYGTLDSAPRYPVQVPIAPTAEDKKDGDDEDGGETEAGVDADCVLMTQTGVQRSYEMYRQKCDFTTQMQLRSIEAGRQRLPAWVIPAIFVLGFNEIWYVLTSPPLLILIVVVGFVFFKGFIIAQWQAFEETGPPAVVIPLQALVKYLQQVYEQSIEPQLQQMQQMQQQQQQQQPAGAMHSMETLTPQLFQAKHDAEYDERPSRPTRKASKIGSSASSTVPTPTSSAPPSEPSAGMRQRTAHKTKSKSEPSQSTSSPSKPAASQPPPPPSPPRHIDPLQKAVGQALPPPTPPSRH